MNAINQLGDPFHCFMATLCWLLGGAYSPRLFSVSKSHLFLTYQSAITRKWPQSAPGSCNSDWPTRTRSCRAIFCVFFFAKGSGSNQRIVDRWKTSWPMNCCYQALTLVTLSCYHFFFSAFLRILYFAWPQADFVAAADWQQQFHFTSFHSFWPCVDVASNLCCCCLLVGSWLKGNSTSNNNNNGHNTHAILCIKISHCTRILFVCSVRLGWVWFGLVWFGLAGLVECFFGFSGFRAFAL